MNNNGIIANPTDLINYNLDPLGNRKNVTNLAGDVTTYANNNINAYTQITNSQTTISPTYSSNGNLLSDGTNTYTYDFENRLIGVNSNIHYQYDALGRRFKKVMDNDTTTYFYYEDQVIQENDSDGNITEHIYLGLEDSPLMTIKNNTSTFYYHLDVLGSVIGLSDETGQVIERYHYDPYGNVQMFNENYDSITSSTIGNSFFYTGKMLDAETGFYFFFARHYDASTGRFLQQDPSAYVDGMNLYQYVRSNPINLVDPNGLASKKPKSGCVKSSFSYEKDYSPEDLKVDKSVNPEDPEFKDKFYIKGSRNDCITCCEDKKQYMPSVTLQLSAGGSFGAEFNLIALIPATRGFVKAASAVGYALFGGVYFSGGASGGITAGIKCGEPFASGCISISVTIGGGFKLTTNKKHKFKSVKVSGGITADGNFTVKMCFKCSKGGCKPDCKSSLTVNVKAWGSISVNVGIFKYNKSLQGEWRKTKFSSTDCGPIPSI